MVTKIGTTLRQAVADLEKEKARIDKQIVALRNAVAVVDVVGGRGRRKVGPVRPAGAVKRGRPKARKPMRAAQRKAVSQRMKAYWAKRRAKAARAREKAGK